MSLAHDFETPFDSIEGAQEYLALLAQALTEAKESTEADVAADPDAKAPRRLEALRLTLYKLDKLEQHIKMSRRLLNDLRTLRRLLLDERAQPATSHCRFQAVELIVTTCLLQRDQHLDHALPFLERLQCLAHHCTQHAAAIRSLHRMTRSG